MSNIYIYIYIYIYITNESEKIMKVKKFLKSFFRSDNIIGKLRDNNDI